MSLKELTVISFTMIFYILSKTKYFSENYEIEEFKEKLKK